MRHTLLLSAARTASQACKVATHLLQELPHHFWCSFHKSHGPWLRSILFFKQHSGAHASQAAAEVVALHHGCSRLLVV
jgi:hypothetical protein